MNQRISKGNDLPVVAEVHGNRLIHCRASDGFANDFETSLNRKPQKLCLYDSAQALLTESILE